MSLVNGQNFETGIDIKMEVLHEFDSLNSFIPFSRLKFHNQMRVHNAYYCRRLTLEMSSRRNLLGIFNY